MVLDDSKILEFQGFVNTLDRMNIQGVKRRYWLKIYNKDPDKAAKLFYVKLDREFSNDRTWKIARAMLLTKYPHFADDPDPEADVQGTPSLVEDVRAPEYNLEYFLQLNGGSWGCAMYDIDIYEQENGVIVL